MSQPIPGALVYESAGSNTGPRAFFANMPLDTSINPDYISFFDDFTILHGKALNATDMYDASVKDASASVALSADILGGGATLSSQATTDNDGATLQCLNQFLMLQSNKKAWFEAKIKVSIAADCDMFIGLAKQIATNPEDIIASTLARVGFELVDGDASLMFSTCTGSVISRTDTGIDMADATYMIVGFYFNGTTCDVYVNRSKVLTGLLPGLVVGTDLVSPAFFGLSGSATGTHTRAIDYWMAVVER